MTLHRNATANAQLRRARALPAGRRSLPIAVVLALGALVAPSCRQVGEDVATQTDDWRLSASSLRIAGIDTLEPAVQEQIRTQHGAVLALAEAEATTEAALGDAVGELARDYHAFAMLEPAAEAYQLASTMAPRDGRWPYYLARIRIEQGAYEEAIELLARTLRLRPDDVPSLIAQGQALHELRQLDAARKSLDRALQLDPTAALALFRRGRVAADAGAWDQAIEFYERALAIQPQATRVHYPLAMAYRQLGQLESAAQHLRQVGRVEPSIDDPLMSSLRRNISGSRLHLERGFSAYTNDHFAVAAQEFQSAAMADPTNVKAFLNLGSALVRLGELEAGERAYRRALELDPDDAKANFSLGTVLSATGRGDESIELYRRSLRRDPDYGKAQFNLANALRRSGEHREALSWFEKVIAAEPGNAAARVGAALCRFHLGDEVAAANQLEGDVGALPDDPELMEALSRLRSSASSATVRDGAQAVELAERALRYHVSWVRVEAVAMAYAEAGRFEEALHWQRSALSAAERGGNTAAATRLRVNLALYERDRPSRTPWLGETP